jgi:Arc/MetJ family transcription regulator
MTKRLVDINDDALAAVRGALETATVTETVGAALTRASQSATQSKELTTEDQHRLVAFREDLGNPEVMAPGLAMRTA